MLVQFLGEVEKEKKTINVILLKYHEKFKVEISSESIYTSDRITNDIMIYGNLLYKGSIFRMIPKYMYLLKYNPEICVVLAMIQNITRWRQYHEIRVHNTFQ